MSEGQKMLAIITMNKQSHWGGGCPVFEVENFEELERIAMYISRIMNGAVHDLENGTYIVVRH